MTKSWTKVDKRKLEQIIRNSPGQVDDALRETALEIVGDMVLSFNSSPPGETYGNHVASTPGYPPNVDTGALRASIRMERKKALEYRVMDGVEYGYYLETGTSKMRARPFFRPAFERASDKLIVRLKRLI